MGSNYFILGIFVLVAVSQIISAQEIEPDTDYLAQEYNTPINENDDDDDDEIETRSRLKAPSNLVNIIQPPSKIIQELITQQKIIPQLDVIESIQKPLSTLTSSAAAINWWPSNSAPSQEIYISPAETQEQLLGGAGGGGGSILGNLLGNNKIRPLPESNDIFSMLKPLLKPIMSLLPNLLQGIPMLPKLLTNFKYLINLPVKVINFLRKISGVLKTVLRFLLEGLGYLLNIFPALFELLPKLLYTLWKVARRIRYILSYPIRFFKRVFIRVLKFIYLLPDALGTILRVFGHVLVSPFKVVGFLIEKLFHLFNMYIAFPIYQLKHFNRDLLELLYVPFNFIRYFVHKLYCTFIKGPIKLFHNLTRAIFIDGILNTIRYIKTVIYEIINVPWSDHYADMFPSAANKYQYMIPLPQQLTCDGLNC